jgi:hypothetical protein
MNKLFDRFEFIKHYPLRIYNRCVFAHNLLEDHGVAYVEDYLATFDVKEREDMYRMYALLKKVGPQKLRALVTEGLEFSDESYSVARENVDGRVSH